MHVYAQHPPPPDVCQQLMSTKKNDGKLRSLYTSQAHYGTSQSQWTSNVAVNVKSETNAQRQRAMVARFSVRGLQFVDLLLWIVCLCL